jgi:trehalose 6-phosphate synthase
MVNPYDSEGVGNAINRALSMPLDERRQRHAANYKMLVRNDVSHWSERFLRTLEQPAGTVDARILAHVAGRR